MSNPIASEEWLGLDMIVSQGMAWDGLARSSILGRARGTGGRRCKYSISSGPSPDPPTRACAS